MTAGKRKKGKSRTSVGNRTFWFCLGLIILSIINLVFLDALVGIRFGKHFLPGPVSAPLVSLFTPRPSGKPSEHKDLSRPKAEKKKAKLADSDKAKEVMPELPERKIPSERKGSRVALVIDDLGYNPEMAGELLKIDFPFTVSILPNLPYTALIARMAIKQGKEVLLHLPMEPYDYPNIRVEEGTLLTSMTDDEIRGLIDRSLDGLDCAIGANNHMGSRMVENEEKMRTILQEMQRRGFFFLDSRTSPRSVVYDLARKMGVRTAKRDVFLDGHDDIDYIHRKLEEVAEIAASNHCGIAIGHLQPNTIKVLKQYMPDLSKRGIQFVKISEVLE